MREDLALAESRDPLSGHEAAAYVRGAGVGELLVIDVDGRVGLGGQHPVVTPLLVEPSGAGVAIVRLVIVTRLDPVQVDADETLGVQLVEVLLQLRPNHVVGRRDHVGQRADAAEVVTDATEGLDFWHRGK